MAILTRVRWNLTLVEFWFILMATDVTHFKKCLLAACILLLESISLDKCPIYWSAGLLLFNLCNYLYILGISPLSEAQITRFPPFCRPSGCSVGSSVLQELFIFMESYLSVLGAIDIPFRNVLLIPVFWNVSSVLCFTGFSVLGFKLFKNKVNIEEKNPIKCFLFLTIFWQK